MIRRTFVFVLCATAAVCVASWSQPGAYRASAAPVVLTQSMVKTAKDEPKKECKTETVCEWVEREVTEIVNGVKAKVKKKFKQCQPRTTCALAVRG